MNTLTGSSVVGTTDSDKIVGTASDDELTGGDGADVLIGDSGDDVLNGGGGADTILGNSGNDVIVGGTGQDALYGGQGMDTINGGSGMDFLSGDRGVDVLTGGSGDDVFYFDARTTAFMDGGSTEGDIITDFEVGDTLVFDRFNLQPLDHYFSFVQDGADTLAVYQVMVKGIWIDYEIARILNANVQDVQASADFAGSFV